MTEGLHRLPPVTHSAGKLANRRPKFCSSKATDVPDAPTRNADRPGADSAAGAAARRMPAGSRQAPRGQAAKTVPAASSGLWWAASLYGLLTLASAVVAGTTFVLVARPVDLIRDRLIAQVQERTGRTLMVHGGASLTLYPALGVVMRDVELAAPDGSSAPPLLRAESVTASVALGMLWKRRVAVQKLSFARPVLDLSIDAEGRRNWDLATIGGHDVPVRLAQLAPRIGHGEDVPPDLHHALERSIIDRAGGREGAGLGALEEIRLVDGAVRYSDARKDISYGVSGLDLQFRRSGPGAVVISGGWVLAGERVSTDGEVRAGEAEDVELRLRLESPALRATWAGRLGLGQRGPTLDGRISAEAQSAAALARWAGHAPNGGDAGGPLTVEGKLRASADAIDLSETRVTLGDVTATGAIGVEPRRDRPLVRADLKVSQVDLDRYLPPASHGGSEPLVPRDVSPGARPAGSIKDLLDRSEGATRPSGADRATRVHGFLRRSDAWSSEPINLRFLGAVDATGSLQFAALSCRQIRLGEARVVVRLEDGTLTTEVEGSDFYGGRGKAVLSMRQEGELALVTLTASVHDAAALPLMRDAAGFEWVEGRGNLTLAIAGQGSSEREIVESVNGRADFRVRDGAIIGWDVAHVLRKVRQGQLTALERHPGSKTPFHDLSGSFAVAEGVATNRDLKLEGAPAAELTGAGAIMLSQRAVDFAVRTRVTLAAADGSPPEPLSVTVPVRIHGAWSRPKFTPDLQGALDDPKTAETIQRLGRQLRSGNVDEAVKSLFGGGPEGEEKAAKARDMLKRFLKP